MTPATAFIALGLLFLLGLVADMVGHKTRLPRVTLLLVLGVVMGRPGFNVIPEAAIEGFEWLSTLALSMVAFLMGGSLERSRLKAYGRDILAVSLAVVITSVVLITGPLILFGVPAELALVLGALACATDPAATRETIAPGDRKGRFAGKLEGIVAIDDAWGLIVFGLAIVVAQSLSGPTDWAIFGEALREIGGAVVLGMIIGFPAAYLTGRITPGEPLRTEALGIVFLASGLAMYFEVSFLLTAMTLGAVITNMARHHRRSFDEIEGFRWPFMVLFFLLAGASLDAAAFFNLGALGVAYVVLRILARFVGGWIGGTVAGSPVVERRWFGVALLSQAGVAVGMALVAAQSFPEFAETILTLTIGATVVFEVIGPIGVAISLRRVKGASSSSAADL
ncbi:MAG: cation:proton antiporter [Rhodobacteraceae bacterium]|nr:cation:proton antiporter [Paracoccaceae bacterium]